MLRALSIVSRDRGDVAVGRGERSEVKGKCVDRGGFKAKGKFLNEE